MTSSDKIIGIFVEGLPTVDDPKSDNINIKNCILRHIGHVD